SPPLAPKVTLRKSYCTFIAPRFGTPYEPQSTSRGVVCPQRPSSASVHHRRGRQPAGRRLDAALRHLRANSLVAALALYGAMKSRSIFPSRAVRRFDFPWELRRNVPNSPITQSRNDWKECSSHGRQTVFDFRRNDIVGLSTNQSEFGKGLEFAAKDSRGDA